MMQHIVHGQRRLGQNQANRESQPDPGSAW